MPQGTRLPLLPQFLRPLRGREVLTVGSTLLPPLRLGVVAVVEEVDENRIGAVESEAGTSGIHLDISVDTADGHSIVLRPSRVGVVDLGGLRYPPLRHLPALLLHCRSSPDLRVDGADWAFWPHFVRSRRSRDEIDCFDTLLPHPSLSPLHIRYAQKNPNISRHIIQSNSC